VTIKKIWEGAGNNYLFFRSTMIQMTEKDYLDHECKSDLVDIFMPQSTTPNSRQVIFRSSIRPVNYPGTTLFEGIVCPKREKTWFEGMGSDLGLDSAGILPSKRVVYLKGPPVRSNEFLKPFVQNEFNCSFFFLRFM
jgi:hypothetical protein